MTLNGLRNTIYYDEQTYLWALNLLHQRFAQNITHSKAIVLKVSYLGILIFSLTGILLVIILMLNRINGPIVTSCILGLLLTQIILEIPLKRIVSTEVSNLIASILPKKALAQTTLPQLSAQLHERYASPDLVDSFWQNNSMLLIGMLFIYTSITWFLSCNFWTWIDLLLLFIWIFQMFFRLKAWRLLLNT